MIAKLVNITTITRVTWGMQLDFRTWAALGKNPKSGESPVVTMVVSILSNGLIITWINSLT
jgi:hypothetical protein